ncbi:hypothetical protein AGMMS50239_19060 [Bacteroidia bacterium]|nr:hypothetical protein AGMMS50239_19060 [Bacteroidia bacterium]
MKRIVFLLICITISLRFSFAQEDGKVTFNEKKHDFGLISEKEGSVNFDFVLTNNSNEPLLINNVKASCGCTTPSWTRMPIEPKKSGTITVSYNPKGQRSSFLKSVMVYTNFSTTPFMLQISGEVTNAPIPPKPEEIYPVALGNYLLKSKELDFGKLDISNTKTIRLEVFNNSDKPVTQKITPPKFLTIDYSPVIEPKTESVIGITFLAKEYEKYGYAKGDLVFYIDGKKQIFPYSALILDDFDKWDPSKKNNAGKLNTNTTEINFGNFTAGTSRTLKLSNSGNSVLNIKNIQSSSPWVVPSKTVFVINKGEITEIKVNVDKNKITSPLVSTLSIVSDDPRNPLFEVKITANP